MVPCGPGAPQWHGGVGIRSGVSVNRHVLNSRSPAILACITRYSLDQSEKSQESLWKVTCVPTAPLTRSKSHHAVISALSLWLSCYG